MSLLWEEQHGIYHRNNTNIILTLTSNVDMKMTLTKNDISNERVVDINMDENDNLIIGNKTGHMVQ